MLPDSISTFAANMEPQGTSKQEPDSFGTKRNLKDRVEALKINSRVVPLETWQSLKSPDYEILLPHDELTRPADAPNPSSTEAEYQEQNEKVSDMDYDADEDSCGEGEEVFHDARESPPSSGSGSAHASDSSDSDSRGKERATRFLPYEEKESLEQWMNVADDLGCGPTEPLPCDKETLRDHTREPSCNIVRELLYKALKSRSLAGCKDAASIYADES